MSVSLTRFSWWLWSGSKEKEQVSNGSSSTDWGFGLRETDSVKLAAKNFPAAPRRVKKNKWHSREERRVDKKGDGGGDGGGGGGGGIGGEAVLVSSDGGVYLSGSESDGPDWSVGWVEPHGPDFRSDDEADDGFAVLVPCYRPGCRELVEGYNNQLLSAIKNLPNGFPSEGKNYMEWLSSFQSF